MLLMQLRRGERDLQQFRFQKQEKVWKKSQIRDRSSGKQRRQRAFIYTITKYRNILMIGGKYEQRNRRKNNKKICEKK